MRMNRTGLLAAALCAALLLSGGPSNAADGDFPIYFENSKLIVKVQSINRTSYLPLTDVAAFMGLPYTDALALETLTVRSGGSRLVATKNSALISLNDQIILLPSPILRENNKWLGPVEFLSQGLARLTGTEFRYRPGTSRIFAGDVEAPELVMNAQSLGPITRLTIRSSAAVSGELLRDERNNRATLILNQAPLDALRERVFEYERKRHEALLADWDRLDSCGSFVVDTSEPPERNLHIVFTDVRALAAVRFRSFMRDVRRIGRPVEELAQALDVERSSLSQYIAEQYVSLCRSLDPAVVRLRPRRRVLVHKNAFDDFV